MKNRKAQIVKEINELKAEIERLLQLPATPDNSWDLEVARGNLEQVRKELIRERAR